MCIGHFVSRPVFMKWFHDWQVYGSQIMHFLDKPADSIDLLRDSDQLVAYRLPKDNSDSSHLVVFMHQHEYMPM